MTLSLYTVVVNWNRPEDTLACVRSLFAAGQAAERIILIDNGSHDDSVARLRAAVPAITLVTNSDNLGFAEGSNVGIRLALKAGADLVLLLNNDAIVDPGCLAALAEAALAHPDAGFLGAKICYLEDPGRIWMGKPVWDARTCRFAHEGIHQLDAESGLHAPSEASYVCGCAMMVTRRALETVGLMDPRFFCYFEEVDWCFRGARHGFRSLYVPAAKVWHKVSASSGGKQTPVVCYFRTRNRLLWAERHLTAHQRWQVLVDSAREAHTGLGWCAVGPRACLQRAYWNLLSLHRDPLLYAWRRGVWDYVCRRFGDAPSAIQRLPRPIEPASKE